MREQLTQYVNLLFAGAPDSGEIREEILQNTLDRYDDLIGQGKSPEAAYRLAISGIGDINEILGTQPTVIPDAPYFQAAKPEEDDPERKKKRACAIMLYILSAIPLIVLSELGASTLGLALTIIMVAAATYTMIITGKKDADDENEEETSEKKNSPTHQLKKSIHAVVDAITIAVYLIVSFATKAWAITWIIFPISGCVNGLVNAIIDLKEANKHEN